MWIYCDGKWWQYLDQCFSSSGQSLRKSLGGKDSVFGQFLLLEKYSGVILGIDFGCSVLSFFNFDF